MTKGKTNPLILMAYLADALMILLHFRLMFSFAGIQVGDAPEYVNYALRVLDDTGFYPTASDFVGVRYIHNPGMVNYLALLFGISRDIRMVFLFNIIHCQVILFSSRYILRRIMSSQTGEYIYQVLFCIYFSLGVSGGIVSAGVEYTFTAMTFLGMALILSDSIFLWPVSGIVLAIANYVRPIFAFVIIPVFVFVFCLGLRNRLKRILLFLGGLITTVLLIACISFYHCGQPVYQATTMWSVLIVGNNPMADGNNTTVVFEEGNYGYVSPEKSKGWTCYDYDDYNKELVIDWVKDNPMSVLTLIPNRLFYFWAVDTYFISAFSNNTEPADKAEYMLEVANKVLRFEFGSLTATMWMSVVTQTVYMIILILGIVAIIIQIKNRDYIGYMGIYVFLLLGNGAYALTYGCARYHFMYIIAIMIMLPYLFCRRSSSSCILEQSL